MGARIEGAYTVRSTGGLFGKGSLKLAVKAAKGCLKRTHIHPSELDLLINTGVYRDGNIGEPAISSFIQEDIKANVGYPPEGATGTFSFDLSNGGCGVITAMQLMNGLITSGSVRTGMIVTSDAEPFPGSTEGYEFVNAGGAVVLRPGEEGAGLMAFHSQNFHEHKDMFESKVVWREKRPGKGRNVLVLKEKKAYMSRCVDCTQQAVERFISDQGLDIKSMDLVIPALSPTGFAKKFRVRMGLRESRVLDLTDEAGNVLTAGPLVGLERAIRKRSFFKARNVLFVTVGAGITVSIAHYRNPEPVPSEEDGKVDPMAGLFEED